MTRSRAIDLYQAGLDLLYLFSEPHGKLVHAMGKPVLVGENEERAYVMLDDNKEIVFCLNESFINSLDDEEDVAFVLLHEALHVAWNHLKELTDDQYPNKKVLTFAHELVINDSITHLSGISTPDMDGPAGDYITGELFGHDFNGMTTREAYDYLIQNAPEEMFEQPEMFVCSVPASTGGDGESSQDGQDGQNGQSAQDIDELMGKVVQAIKDEFAGDDKGLSATGAPESLDVLDDNAQGSSTGGNLSTRPYDEINGMEFNYAELLARINPKILTGLGGKGINDYKMDWTAPRHSMRSLYPDIIIPNYKQIGPDGDSEEDSSPEVLFAVDQSGSISKKYVDISMDMLKKMPDDLFTPHMALWANYCEEYIPGKQCYIGGGTDIHSVYRYAEALRKKVGKDIYVVVYTDGGYGWNMSGIDKDWVNDYWFFVGFDRRDRHNILDQGYHGNPVNPDNVYNLDDLWKS